MPEAKYQCIRCGYSTPRKSNILHHFGKKKPCPTSLNDIELTDEIKQHIINYQVYHINKIEPADKLNQKLLTNSTVKLPACTTKVNNTELTLRKGRAKSTNKKRKGGTGSKVVIRESTDLERNELATIANVTPLAKTTACGQPVWVLYAVSGEKRSPIRTVIENGERKIHLFDFIQAMTGCDDNSVRKEWGRLQNRLDKAIVTKITMAQKYQCPEVDRNQLTKTDSMVIDISQATEIASEIGARAKWFTQLTRSLTNRFMAGDLDLIADVEYMNIAQQLIREHDPTNFLRLWGEAFLHNTQAAQQAKSATNPEQIIGSTADEVKTLMDRANITRATLNRSLPRARNPDPNPDCVGLMYAYPLKPVFETRPEALEFLDKRDVRIKSDHPAILCQEDLGGRHLLKVGKTEFLPENRQIDYTRAFKDLYLEDQEHLVEYPIKFIAKLTNVENEVRRAVFTREKVCLIRDDGTEYYPREVFLVDSVEDAQQTVKQAIQEIQMGQPVNVNTSDPELSKM